MAIFKNLRFSGLTALANPKSGQEGPIDHIVNASNSHGNGPTFNDQGST